MIKKIDEITISDFDRMKRTGKVSHLKKAWNILPTIFFLKSVIKLKDELLQMINGDNPDDDLEQLEERTRMTLEIIELESLFYVLQKWLIVAPRLNTLMNKAANHKKIQRILKDIDTTQLKKAIEKIKELIAIDIDEKHSVSQAIQTIYEEIEFRTGKFNEMFNEPNKNKKVQNDLTLLEYASVYCSSMGEPINGLSEMKIIEFIALKKRADERSKQQNNTNTANNGE